MNRRPAQCFPLRDYLWEELHERGWGVADLCRLAVLPEDEVRAVLDDPGGRLSLRVAERIGLALGVSPATLLNLQRAYRQWLEGKGE